MGEGGWDRLHKQVALLLQVCCAESSSERFLTLPEEPESTFVLFHSNLSLVFVHTEGKNAECAATDVSPLGINS